jgi:acetate kinase
MVELGGIDVITFSGGIGENCPEIRDAVLRGLATFGVELDDETNASMKGEGEISTLRSLIKVLVIPANEESIVARETVAVVEKQGTGTRG